MSSILIISPEPWEGHSVSKHHYAMELARQGHNVFFLDPPVPGLKTIEFETVERANATLKLVRSNLVARGMSKMPGLIRNFLERHWLKRLEKLVGKRMEVIWLFENSRFFDMRFAGDRLKIYHQVDLNQDFNPQIAAETSDLAIGISGPIERRIKKHASNFLRLGHGVSVATEKPLEASQLEQAFPHAKFHAVLTGNLDIRYLDIDLLSTLVEQNEEAVFHLVGKFSKDGELFRRIGNASNVVWWGFMPADSLQSILRCADLAILTYLSDEHRDQLANPHKVLEYMLSGTPILATHTEEYAGRPDLVDLAENRGDFLAKFMAYAKGKSEGQRCMADVNCDIRLKYAKDHTYQKQIERIADALGQILTLDNPLRNPVS